MGLGKLKRKVEVAMLGKLLAIAVKKLAEGDFGTGPAKVYWWLAGKKTPLAVAVAAVAGGLSLAYKYGLCEPCADYVDGIIKAAGILVAIGVFDAAVRIAPPERPIETYRR